MNVCVGHFDRSSQKKLVEGVLIEHPKATKETLFGLISFIVPQVKINLQRLNFMLCLIMKIGGKVKLPIFYLAS